MLEAVILLVLFVGVFQKEPAIVIDAAGQTLLAGVYDSDTERSYIDQSSGYSGAFSQVENLELKKGVYKISLDFFSEGSHLFEAKDDTLFFGSFLSNPVTLYPGDTKAEFTLWLLEDTKSMSLITTYSGTGSLRVGNIQIEEDGFYKTGRLIFCLLLFLGIDFILMIRKRRGLFFQKKEQKIAFFALCGIIFTASLPLMLDNVYNSGYILQQLYRIDGIKDALASGQFPVRIYPEMLNEYGYAGAITSSDLFLYLPALFYLFGLPLQTAWQAFILLINTATALLAYVSFGRIARKRYVGVFGSMLYTLSAYRLNSVYFEANVQEFLFLMFLPFLAYTLYRLFTQECNTKKYGTLWLPLTLAFSGILQSSFSAFLITGIFVLLLFLMRLSKISRRSTFFVLMKTMFATVLLNLWFLVPAADYGLFTNAAFMKRADVRIQSLGMGIGSTNTMNLMEYLDWGILLGLLVFIALTVTQKASEKSKKLPTGLIALLMSALALFMCTNKFPWDAISDAKNVFAIIVSIIAAPFSFLCIVILGIILTACIGAEWVLQKNKEIVVWVYFSIITVITFTTANFLMDEAMLDRGFFRIFDGNTLISSLLLNDDSLPGGTDTSLLPYQEVIASEGLVVTEYQKDGLMLRLHCENVSEESGLLEVPLLYFKGYEAIDLETGKKLDLSYGTNNVLQIQVPYGYCGTLEVSFHDLWYWKVANVISLFTILGLLFLLFVKVRKNILPELKNTKMEVENELE